MALMSLDQHDKFAELMGDEPIGEAYWIFRNGMCALHIDYTKRIAECLTICGANWRLAPNGRTDVNQ